MTPRPQGSPGPPLRTDVIDAYVLRRQPAGIVELLQLRRSRPPMAGAWHPVMGHIEPGERAVDTCWRELREELRLDRGQAINAWALEQVHPFFLAERNEIYLSPRFAVEVRPAWEPMLNHEHDAARWIRLADAPQHFLWPGQHASIAELATLLAEGSPLREALRIPV